MMSSSFAVAAGYGAYLFLIASLTLSGLGVLRLVRAGLDCTLTWLLAPCAGQALLACLLGLTASLRLPVRATALWIALAMAAAAAAGAYDLLRAPDADRRRVWTCLALACLLPFASLWPYLGDGLTGYRGSGLWDGWSYVAFGQYLWDYPRGADGGLPVFYQYGAAFSYTRFVAAANLPFLASILRLPDAQAAFGLLQATGLFSLLTSCAAFAWTRQLSLRQTAAYLVLGASGWTWNVVWANNCDHLFALAYFPALFSIIGTSSSLTAKRGPLAILIAASCYTFPELAWLSLGASMFFLWEQLRRRPEPHVWWTLVSIVGVAGLLLGPYVETMARFVGGQVLQSFGLHANNQFFRPGDGFFGGVLAPAWVLSAVWGLGGEHVLSLGWHAENAIGLILCLVFLAGLVRLVRAGEYGLTFVLVVLLAAVALFGLVLRYSYGTYKVLLTSWWLLAFTLVIGVEPATSSPPRHRLRARAWQIASVLALLALPVATFVRGIALVTTPGLMAGIRVLPARYFRDVMAVAPLAGGSPLALVLDDVEANQWALYYLRDQPVRIGIINGYLGLPFVQASLDRARPVPWTSVRYLLADAGRVFPFADAQGWTRRWSSGPYALWDTGAEAWAVVTGLATPNGLETDDGHAFFWMGGGSTRIELLSSSDGVATLSADFSPGPSVPASSGAVRRVLVRDGEGGVTEHAVQAGAGAVPFRVRAGFNVVTLTPLDRVSVSAPAQGDRRPLVLGLHGPRLVLTPARQP